MIKPAVVVVSPYSVDFPLWRQLMEDYQDRFSRIVHVIHADYRSVNHREFLSRIPWAMTIDIGGATGIDWRCTAVRRAMHEIHLDEWVLFLEQDFLPRKPDSFFDCVFSEASKYDAVGFVDGDALRVGVRLHPAFLLVRRSKLGTDTDFGAYPKLGLDHFGLFSDDLVRNYARIKTLQELGLLPERDWKHWAGVTHNIHLLQEEKEPCYRPEEFRTYLRLSLTANVSKPAEFVDLANTYLERSEA